MTKKHTPKSDSTLYGNQISIWSDSKAEHACKLLKKGKRWALANEQVLQLKFVKSKCLQQEMCANLEVNVYPNQWWIKFIYIKDKGIWFEVHKALQS